MLTYRLRAMNTTTADRIERFLAANPSGPLVIAVGYASAFGLAWLQERTTGRPVSVLIGDTRTTYWQKMTSQDRSGARRFLMRSDVEVHNWYRTGQASDGRSEAHLKAWLVHDNTRVVAVLVGSANLTHNGLYKNVEVMVEPTAGDFASIWRETHALWGKSWDAKDRLIRYLDGDFARHAQATNPRSRRPAHGSRKSSTSFSTSKPRRRRRFS